MHSSQDIEAAASALANQLSAGINIREAVARMAKLQPKHVELWQTAAEALSRGGRLSAQLTEAWPESVVAALKAGEESGTIEEVLRRTAHTMQVGQQVRKIYGKLASPLISFFAGFGVLLFFMIAVIPKLAASLGGGESSLVFKVAMLMNEVVMGYWPVIAAGTVGSIVFLVQWLRQPENLDKLIAVADKVPQLGPALRNLYFGMWAHQLSLLAAAGLPAKQQLLLSVKTLPDCYRDGVLLMAADVEKRGHADSADPDKQSEDDPRKQWPYYIATAFITAHETGRIDQEMQRCAPILLDDGLRQLTRVTAVADLVAKILAAQMIAAPLLAYFTQLSNSLTKAFS